MLRFKLAKAFEILVTLKFLPFWSKKMNTFLFIFYIAAKKTSHMACQIHILKLILHMKHNLPVMAFASKWPAQARPVLAISWLVNLQPKQPQFLLLKRHCCCRCETNDFFSISFGKRSRCYDSI